ncbi:hypothetical protein MLD38_023024 [Melastoma candidum]|uniref:Uncharacterized protein n=1 Tax=Melastoma candidum TaxID=119954 RepID=A0ACB9QP89_9MYRT|nr:hypothetical protein MLD38_023024 [Melastoma candidum]
MDFVKVVLLSFSLLVIVRVGEGQVPKQVIIRNGIPDKTLGLHCASADDDLGYHELSPGQDWGFSFRTRFLGGTLFYCTFRWHGRSHTANVFQQGYNRCTTCRVMVGVKGICYFDDPRYLYDCRPWY